MKTLTKDVYQTIWTTTTDNNEFVGGYIEIKIHFSFRKGFSYTVNIPNYSITDHKLCKALLLALKHEIMENKKVKS